MSGKLINELAEEFECCIDTIRQALKLANIDTILNKNKKSKKEIIAKTITDIFVKSFASRKEAAEWLIKEGFTQSKDIDNIVATIGRAANGKRKTAYTLKWENKY